MTIRLSPGILIAFEGIDGAGKTTQAVLLAERLREVDLGVVLTKEPTAGPWGQKLRESAASGRLSADEEFKAFIEDRKEHVRERIAPALDAGNVVIVDRYYLSTAAYQGARGMDPDELMRFNERFAPKPDICFLLKIDPAAGLARIRRRDGKENHFEKEEDLRDVATKFDSLQRDFIRRLDGTAPVDCLNRLILRDIYNGPLFQRLCLKSHYKDECEPAYCTERVSEICDYIKVGDLVPAPTEEQVEDAIETAKQMLCVDELPT